MERFFGMMPSDEVTISKSYKDAYGLSIDITAGPHGWTTMFADGSNYYKDVDDTDENNFKRAYDAIPESLHPLTEIESGRMDRRMSSEEVDEEKEE